MASPVNAFFCATVAVAFCTLVGYALTRHLLPRVLAIGAAPVVGWAVFSAITLPAFILLGFSPPAVGIVAALCVVVGSASLLGPPAGHNASDATSAMPPWTFPAAALLALAPAVAILPKFSADGVHLADPIFDHSKIAIIDAIMRQGLPPIDPVSGGFGATGRLAYYYLWHFSAAALALPLRASGWEADIGLTWFTAFASLALMMGLAVWLGKRPAAALWVVAFAAAASLRTALRMLFGSYGLEPFLASPSGFAGWLFQSAWVPQHLMSATCVVTALLLIAEYARRQCIGLLVILALVIVAGFESSTYVGGITFAIAALAAAPIVYRRIEPDRRVRVAIGLAATALVVIGFTAPFILDQLAMVAARGGASPVTVHPFDVLGGALAPALRRLLDIPAYWLILLPIEFPATFVAGAIALTVMLRGAMPGPEKTLTAVFAVLGTAGLCVSWLLVGTLGDNNDLSLRAVLPAAMVLIVGAAVGMILAPRRVLIVATALSGLVLSLPDTVVMIGDNAKGSLAPDSGLFAQAPDLWAAVRRYAPPAARVANNPLYLQDLTPWPANMSWALLADRSSCFAGRELTLAFAPLPPARREAINAEFIRVFDGKGSADDVADMANKYRCDVVVVVPQDGAWAKDPFVTSPEYQLTDVRDGRWRIYRRVAVDPAR
jgi:hypothetical protein